VRFICVNPVSTSEEKAELEWVVTQSTPRCHFASGKSSRRPNVWYWTKNIDLIIMNWARISINTRNNEISTGVPFFEFHQMLRSFALQISQPLNFFVKWVFHLLTDKWMMPIQVKRRIWALDDFHQF
jgi:hypothetical protein